MKVKKNNRLLIISIVILALLILLLLLVTYMNIGIDSGFISAVDKISSEQESLLDVIHYDIDLNLYPGDRYLVGKIIIGLKYPGRKSAPVSIDLYDNMKVTKLIVNGMNADFDHNNNKIVIDNKYFEVGNNNITIAYEGTPRSEGLGSFSFDTYMDKSFIYSLSEPVFASTWLACNDSPTDKATVTISITNDSDYVSVSNGRLIETKTNGSRRTYTYNSRYQIATYLIALYSADYVKFSASYLALDNAITMPINYYVTEDKLNEAQNDFSIHPEAIKILAELFGEYPFIEDGYGVAQFLWQMGAMEHQTITGIGANYISGHKFHTGTLVHEIAHHWWGNSVTPKSWKDIWLNEGFATYSEALYWEKKSDARALRSTMSGYFKSFEKHALYDPGIQMFSRLVYEKGAWVLHMLRREVGDETFFKILRTYYEMYKYANANTHDFITVCETVADRNLKYFFDQWVYNGVGIIELKYDWKLENGKIMLQLIQAQQQNITYNFLVDVEIIGEKGNPKRSEFRIGTRDTIISIPFTGKPGRVIIDPDGWLLASKFQKIGE